MCSSDLLLSLLSLLLSFLFSFFFFFNDTATTEIYTLSLHDALPILLRSVPCPPLFSPLVLSLPLPSSSLLVLLFLSPSQYKQAGRTRSTRVRTGPRMTHAACRGRSIIVVARSEEHTSELQSLTNLVCRLLLEKKKTKQNKKQIDAWLIHQIYGDK